MSNENTTDPRIAARQSYSGQRLTEAEFEDAYAIAGIIGRDIQKTGSFYESRENYSFAFSKGKKITPDQAQDVIADIFKARFVQTMNQMREKLIERDEVASVDQAASYAAQIAPLIRDGETMPFYRAYDVAAGEMARDIGITEKRAKELMKEAHAAESGGALYDTGKELEAAYHTPVVEAAKAERKKVSQNKKQKPKRKKAQIHAP